MSTGNILVWAGLVVVGAAVLAPALPRDSAPPPQSQAPVRTPAADGAAATPMAGNGFASQILQRAPDGHFYADAQVNGARIRFMIDTGASMVALTRADAQRAGLTLGQATGRAIGAGGEIAVVPVTIDRLAVGPLEARDVSGAVVEELPVSLLGQSYLEQVGSVEIRGDTMVLR